MKAVLLILVATFFAASGCGHALKSVQLENDGLEVDVRVAQSHFEPEEPVVVEITVKNSSTSPVRFQASTTCDTGLQVHLQAPDGEQVRFKPAPGAEACPLPFPGGVLEPGAQFRTSYQWDQRSHGAPVPFGTYPVTVTFKRLPEPATPDPWSPPAT